MIGVIRNILILLTKEKTMLTKKEIIYLNGYRCVLRPDHPRSMHTGYVYEHILVAEKYLGRNLNNNEVVHHLDLDRSNNRKENLLVLEKSQHGKLHYWLKQGAPVSKDMDVNRVNSVKPKENKFCKSCGLTLQEKQKEFCSIECSSHSRRVAVRPSKIQLAKDIKELSWLAIGKKYGVSDNAARKWAKAYNLR